MKITFNSQTRTILIQDRPKRTFNIMVAFVIVILLQIIQISYEIYLHGYGSTSVYMLAGGVFVFVLILYSFFTRSYKESFYIDDVVSIKFRKRLGVRSCIFKLKNGKSRPMYQPLFEYECNYITAEAEKYCIPVK